ncbi:MAG: helix-turn-helix domain-containing protein, partial [Planctomycetota bacterium]
GGNDLRGRAGRGGATPTADEASTADLRRLMRFVENHLAEPLALRELAAFSGLSRSHIGRLFRRHLNTTPVDWITRTRIEQAKRMLASSGLPVGQVGARVGIADPYYFSKLFRKTTGLSAKAYRRATALL